MVERHPTRLHLPDHRLARVRAERYRGPASNTERGRIHHRRCDQAGRSHARVFFRKSTPIDADTSEADPGAFSATRESDLNTIPIGDERYETPDAVVLGG